MTGYHEVLRNDLERELTPLADRGALEEFAEAWADYRAAVGVHTAMEDGHEGGGGGIDLLKRCFEGATRQLRFDEEHHREHEAQASVSVALRQGRSDLRHAFGAYRRMAEDHLIHEEEVVRPLLDQLTAPNTSLFSRWCLTAGVACGGIEQFVAHGVASFATHGSRDSSPERAIAQFLRSLQTTCSDAQWAVIQTTARAAAFGTLWAAVIAEEPSLRLATAG